MKLSKVEQKQFKVEVKKEKQQSLMHTEEYYKWLPVALEKMARTTFDQRVRTGYGTLEECATNPVNKNKSTKRGQRIAISELCDQMDIPRVSFYKWRKRQPNGDEIAKLDNDVQVAMYAEVRKNERL